MRLNHIPASSRGYVHQDWLEGWYSFSFAGWHDPERIHFGALRVLNDDIIAPASGFGFHPHRDMEIVTIVLSGTLTHRDNTGGTGQLRNGDVQVMTAGKGIVHSEMNQDPQEEVRSLQLWFFPREMNLEPRYDQAHVPVQEGEMRVLVSGNGSAPLQVSQDMQIVRMKIPSGMSMQYTPYAPSNCQYVFIIEGEGTVENVAVSRRDAVEVTEAEQLQITAGDSLLDVLIMDVPA